MVATKVMEAVMDAASVEAATVRAATVRVATETVEGWAAAAVTEAVTAGVEEVARATEAAAKEVATAMPAG